jgi:hypothetical protein
MSVIDTPSAHAVTIRPSVRGTTTGVRASTAGMSDATIVSPLPSPTTSGEATFTPTISPGWSAEATTKA